MLKLKKRQKQVLDYITRFINKNNYSPSFEEIRKHFRLSSKSTVYYHIEKLKDRGYLNKIDYQARSLEIKENKKSESIAIPLLGTIAAGEPIEAIEVPEKIKVPKSQLSKSGEHFALKVQGNSMIDDGVYDGDTVIIRKQQTAENGETIVALINDNEVTLKKIYKEKNGFRLQPANPNVKPLFEKELIIQGKVISVIRNFEELKRKLVPRETKIRKRTPKKQKRKNKIEKWINTIQCMDCVETMKKLPDNCIDLVVTSPPYDDLRLYGAHTNRNKTELNGYSFPFEKIAKELYRVIKHGGVVIWVVGDATIDGNETGNSFRQALYFKSCGFKLFDTMIYSKPPRGAVGNNKTYWQSFEYMFVFSKGHPKTINLIKDRKNKEARSGDNGTKRLKNGELLKIKRGGYGDFGRRKNIWEYNIGKGHSTSDTIAFKHPAIFPEKLARDHIYTWSNKGDLVYDPMMGSGTVAKICILEGRNYLGSEINKDYCEIAKKRLSSI